MSLQSALNDIKKINQAAKGFREIEDLLTEAVGLEQNTKELKVMIDSLKAEKEQAAKELEEEKSRGKKARDSAKKVIDDAEKKAAAVIDAAQEDATKIRAELDKIKNSLAEQQVKLKDEQDLFVADIAVKKKELEELRQEEGKIRAYLRKITSS